MLAIIGGTGLNEFRQGQPCGELSTPFGEVSAPIISSKIGDRDVCFLARHGNPHSIAPHKINYRANLWALKQLGVAHIIAVNAVGGISEQMAAGALVVPDQIIDYSYGREHTFFDGVDGQLEHVDFSYPFTDRLRQLIINAAKQSALSVEPKAVYGVTQGPRLETAAEVERMERDGCDIVGMTAMPEAGLARELGLDYASFCLVVNPAAGRSDSLITMDDIHRVVERGMVDVREVLNAVICNGVSLS